ncbi:RIB43A-like with coiled-coils protein 2 [Eriocheir sinensis]|uniref:RIB43A-like with coiled-coils protein 2 n=1 Tax=Eriocheir sinensis TaxID=95602 RepID=UPI0021C9CB29|nr:RIB43A-like with coiled-coils protein 2 [Eriocheir sinensis]
MALVILFNSTKPATSPPEPTTTTTAMPSFNPDTTAATAAAPALPSWVLEARDAAAIARRRRLLQERAYRIHAQPRSTSIAVDVEGLTQQVEERRRREEQQEREEEEFMRLAATQDRAALLLHHREDKAEEERREALKTFWREEQRPERRRDADLEAREHVTSALYELRFEGEDLGRKDREQAQRQQAREWLQQQRDEQRLREQQEQEQERLRELECAEAADRARQLGQAEEELRRAESLALTRYNLALSREREVSRYQDSLASREAEHQEVANAVMGSFLTEAPAQARSALGPHRVIPHRWKGMSEGERRSIQETRERQVAERKRREEEERRRDAAWEDYASHADRAALKADHRHHTDAKRREQQLAATNQHLAQQQHQYQRRLTSALTSPDPPTQDFYNKFGVHPR